MRIIISPAEKAEMEQALQSDDAYACYDLAHKLLPGLGHSGPQDANQLLEWMLAHAEVEEEIPPGIMDIGPNDIPFDPDWKPEAPVVTRYKVADLPVEHLRADGKSILKIASQRLPGVDAIEITERGETMYFAYVMERAFGGLKVPVHVDHDRPVDGQSITFTS